MKKVLSICCLSVIGSYGFAQEIKGISFSHQEWEISCSNTGTCKAAGYQSEENGDNPASLLLVRKAGQNNLCKLNLLYQTMSKVCQPTSLKIFILYKWQRFRRCDCRWY